MSLARRLLLVCVLLLLIIPMQQVFGFVAAVPASPHEKDAGVSLEVLRANLIPNVTVVTPGDESVFNRAYRRVLGDLAFYDSPGGAMTENMGIGFNFVTGGQNQNGYTQVGVNRWLSAESLSSNVKISRFGGVLLPEEPLPFTVAWVVQRVRPSLNAGEAEAPTNPLLERYTLVNLFTYVELDDKRWYQIGENQWVHQYNVAKIAPVTKPEGVESQKWVSVDLYEQVMIAYDGDTPVFATLIASGLPQWATPEGIFHVYLRAERIVMSGAFGQPDFYYLQDVPWNMFFNEDVALHGTYWHDGFGYRHSHGCVNLSLTDANWLYNWSISELDTTVEGDKDLGVYVFSSGTYD